MAEVQINLLGPAEIRWGGQLLIIQRRIPRTMFFFLASRENFVGRGTLLTTFWEDSPATFARRRLREALSRIRADLPDPGILISKSNLVGLDPTRITVDQHQFLGLIEETNHHSITIPLVKPLPQRTYQTMSRAAKLWRGFQFMEGVNLPDTRPIDDWLRQTNLQLAHLRTRLFLLLSDHYHLTGQLEEALDSAYKALESDGLNEDIHSRILRLLIDMGQFQQARNYYSTVINLLSNEYNSHPSRQLVSLYRQIQEQSTTTFHSIKQEWRILTSIHTPYVGRKSEISQLERALDNGGGVTILGESGLGKTRLVQEFCELYASDSRIMVAPCRSTESNLPFQPIIELLRNHIHSTEWQDLSNVWIDPLRVLLPELFSIHHSDDIPILSYEPHQYRSSLFEAIRQLFNMLSKKDELIIFFDDAQWADEATLSAIAYLVERSPFDQRSIIILAAWSEETNQSFDEFLSSFRNSTNFLEIDLERLNSQETSTLSRYVLGYPLNNELIDQLSHESGGNPFILLETLRAFQDQETKSINADSPSFPMTRSVYSLIQNRIERLSPLARETSEIAAVIGNEFDPELISIASQQNLSITARGIEELNQRNLIESSNHSPQDFRYRFIHEKIRETIISETNPVRFRYLNKQIAQALESRIDSQPQSQAAILAQHYESAGIIPTAIKYWLQAGQWARQLYSTAEAEQIFSHAEQLIPLSNSQITDELIHDLYSEWTEMAYVLRNIDSIHEQNNNLLKIGKERNSPLLIGSALDGLSDSSMARNEFEEGLSLTSQALAHINQTDNTFEKMDTNIHHGVFLYMLGRLNEAFHSLELALELGEKSENLQIQRATANAHYHLSLTKTLSGWPDSGLKHAYLSLDLAERLELHHNAVTAYTASSLALYFMADYEKSRQVNQEGIEIATRLHADRMLGYLYVIRGFLETASGDVGAAYRSAQLVTELAEVNNYSDLKSISNRVTGDIFLLLEAPAKACEYFQGGVNFGSHNFWGLDNLIHLGYAQIRDNQVHIGMNNLNIGIAVAKESGLGIIELLGTQFLCCAYIFLGDWEQARITAYHLESLARKRKLVLTQLMSQVARVISESKTGDKIDSIEQLQLSLEAVAEIGQPFIELRILLRLIKSKKAGGLDTNAEVQRVNYLLEKIEQNAYPEILHQAAIDFRKMKLNAIAA